MASRTLWWTSPVVLLAAAVWPAAPVRADDAGKQVDALTAQLQSGQPPARMKAAQQLSKIAGPGAEAALALAMKDASASVRREVVRALQGREGAGVVQMLVSAARDKDLLVSESAMTALEKRKTPEVVASLLSALPVRDIKQPSWPDVPDRKPVGEDPLAELLKTHTGAYAVAPLRAGLKHKNPYARQVAVAMLARTTKTEGVVEALAVAATTDASDAIAEAAAQALRGAEAKRVVPACDRVFRSSQSATERYRAVRLALGAGASTPEAQKMLAAALSDRDPRVRSLAREQIARQPAADVVAPLVAAFADSEGEAREEILERLAETKDPRAAPVFVAALKDRELRHRQTAVGALLDLPPDPKSAEPLLAILRNGREYVIPDAVVLLGRLKDKRAVGPMLQLFSNDRLDRTTHDRIVEALGRIGAEAVAALAAAAEKGDPPAARPWAVRGLGRIGPPARAAAPVLLKLLDEPKLASDAARALGRIGGEDVIKILGARYKPGLPPALQESLVEALARSGDPPSLALLERDLKEYGYEPILARNLLAGGSASARAVVLGQLGQMDREKRRDTILEMTDGDDPGFAPFAVEALLDKDESVRDFAREALSNLARKHSATVVPVLLAALKRKEARVRDGAAYALSSCYEARVFQALIALLDDRDRNVRDTVRFVLNNATGVEPDYRAQDSVAATKKWWQTWWRANGETLLKRLRQRRRDE